MPMTNNQVSEAVNYNEMAGELVHQAMWRQKRTQTEVAATLGITQSTLSRKLRGARGWDIGELINVAKLLDVAITDLIPAHRSDKEAESLTQYYLTVKSDPKNPQKGRSKRRSENLLQGANR